MGWWLDRTPMVVIVVVGFLLSFLAGLVLVTAPTVPAVGAVAVVALYGVVAVWLISLVLTLYRLAFVRPSRTIRGRHPILRLLLGLVYVAAAILALDLSIHFLGLIASPHSLPAGPEFLNTWLLHDWLLPAVGVIPILLLMRLLAGPWLKLRARLIRLATFGTARLQAHLAHLLPISSGKDMTQ